MLKKANPNRPNQEKAASEMLRTIMLYKKQESTQAQVHNAVELGPDHLHNQETRQLAAQEKISGELLPHRNMTKKELGDLGAYHAMQLRNAQKKIRDKQNGEANRLPIQTFKQPRGMLGVTASRSEKSGSGHNKNAGS